MALGDERRASGKRMEQARRQGGVAMESQRRALDAAMVARRRGESVVEDMQRLESPPRAQRSLPQVTPRGGIPAARGRAYYQDKPKMGQGGGIAWPLTEDDAATREFYAPRLVSSSDGLIAIRLRPLRSMTLRDGDDETGQILLAEP